MPEYDYGKFKVGAAVRLKLRISSVPGKRKITTILHHMPSQYQGGVHLTDKLDGTAYWNIAALELVKEKSQ